MKQILAPHPKQDGFVYIRVPRGVTRWFDEKRTTVVTPLAYWRGMVAYHDDMPGTRAISSRRVEEAVETADYRKRCADEGLHAVYHSTGGKTHKGGLYDAGWTVFVPDKPAFRQGTSTLREAYFRYVNGAAL